MKKNNYITVREGFQEGSIKHIITLTDSGYKNFEELKLVLHKFLTNSPENYLNYVDKHYSDKFELEDE